MGGDICKLCKKEAELRHSHILPEFFYLGIYESHRALEISHDGEKKIQKGIREYLLCQKCETKLSHYEGYAAKLTRSIPDFVQDPSGRFIYKEDIDYLRFKLFQLSILWRASVSKYIGFEQVSLGAYHEEKIRRMLDEEIPGKSSEYGCVMMTMLNTELIHQFLLSPTRVRPRPFGYTAYKFMTGNLIWLFFVTSHAVNALVQEYFLQESGLLRIWLAPNEKPLLMNIARHLRRFKGSS